MEDLSNDLQESQKKKSDENYSSSNQKEDYPEVKVISPENGENIKSDYTFKVIVIGNSSVGKSSLIDRATKNRFLGDYNPTIGFDFCSFYVKYKEKVIKLQIWDTCGQ